MMHFPAKNHAVGQVREHGFMLSEQTLKTRSRLVVSVLVAVDSPFVVRFGYYAETINYMKTSSVYVCKLLWPALRAHAGYRKTKRRDSQDILCSGARSVRTTESQGKLVNNPSTRKISKIFFSCRVAPLVRDRGFHVALAGELMRPGFGVLFCFFSKKRPQRRHRASIHILDLPDCMLWSITRAFLHELSREIFRTQSVAGVSTRSQQLLRSLANWRSPIPTDFSQGPIGETPSFPEYLRGSLLTRVLRPSCLLQANGVWLATRSVNWHPTSAEVWTLDTLSVHEAHPDSGK
ncbi:hypothetical protein BO79DRAFT_228941 [Aspergillus costaricaensis CBS 115574]|uniref:Uncharacterized protein n=1 Tax=Aspergillus costaricaensis CBS 115574 TaxID=1448317 RepID=A0ACD1ICV2_9EURO|nr:hypothetical protein BO79DRAFT_228941 [Aspergillus costaricaensis CBS 115574]RAK88405.1 hypothetical protein BO79DRAFT_228941 [Aspergillus costaricaensis CBS 115574]